MISGDLFDEAESRRIATESYDRCFHPAGTMFQIAAIAASGDRTAALAADSTMPTLVIHGRQDLAGHAVGWRGDRERPCRAPTCSCSA
jgi:pimeloyl-ACP methyl ester carboxylesterase